MAAPVGLDRARVHEHIAIAGLDAEGGHVVGERVERAAAGKVELRVVPVAGQDAVAYGPTAQWEAHVGTAVVEGVQPALVVDDEDGPALGRDDLHPLALDLLERPRANERLPLRNRGHGRTPRRRASSMRCRG